MRFFLLVVFAICIFSIQSTAQQVAVQPSTPASLKWFQTNTDHFRVLFPEGFEEEAQRTANTLEHIYEPEASSYDVDPKRISVLLQNQTASSNGFVSLLPRRSEFYAMPPQDYNFTGVLDWMDLLAVHEYRHVVQYEQSRVGFSKLAGVLLGNTALSGLSHSAVPLWFWEGDAVVTETRFSKGGRGRIPYFNLVYRTNLLEGRRFKYNKQFLGSFKHYVPNHYVLGYNMVSYLQSKTDNPEVWSDISRQAWRTSFIPFAFPMAIKKYTGQSMVGLYEEMMDSLSQKWESQIADLSLTSFETMTVRERNAYTNYLYPQPLDNGGVAFIKSGVGDIGQIVIQSPEGEEVDRHVLGVVNDSGVLSAAKGRVAWNEFRFDPRWSTRTYSVVMGYDFNTHERKTISRKSRYAGATLSHDGTKVATVETNESYETRLIILDYETGNVVKEFPNPENSFISMPRWDSEGNGIVALRTQNSERWVDRYDVNTNERTVLLFAEEENVGFPVLHSNFLLYSSAYSGIDNIYALNIETGEKFQVTSSKLAAYNPAVSPDGAFIYYNEQTKDGIDVVRIPFNPNSWKAVDQVVREEALYPIVTDHTERSNLLQSTPSIKYPVSRYRRVNGIFNPHSWGPYFISNINDLFIGVSSEDVLTTTVMDLGYLYDVNEQAGIWNARISYQGLYPIIDFTYQYGNRSSSENILLNGETETIDFDWTEQKIETGIRIPLVTTVSKYQGSVSLGSRVGYTQVTDFANSFDEEGRLVNTSAGSYFFEGFQDNGNLLYTTTTLYASRLLKKSRRDINSPWGQTVSLNYTTTPAGDFDGGLYSAWATLYFPGFARHHSVHGHWAYQYTKITDIHLGTGAGLDNYWFRNTIPLPRGISVPRYETIYSMSANYTAPIVYPDISITPVIYIPRIRATAFADYAFGETYRYENGQPAYYSQDFLSVGAEMRLDVNFLRIPELFNLGFRYSYVPDRQVSRFEFILGNIGF